MLPFSYGLVVEAVYENGTAYSAAVLDLTDDKLIASFQHGLRNVAAVSLAVGIPTAASAPHSLVKGLKNILAVAIAADIDIPLAEKVRVRFPSEGGEGAVVVVVVGRVGDQRMTKFVA